MPSQPPRKTTAPDAPFHWAQEAAPRAIPARTVPTLTVPPQVAQVAGKAAVMAQRALLWLGIWLLLGLASVVLLLLGFTGHGYAWGLLLLLILGSASGLWVYLRNMGLRAGQYLGQQHLGQQLKTVEPPLTGLSAEAQARIRALEHLSRRTRLSAPLALRLQQAVSATRAALLGTAEAGLITREAHEARTAAEQDIPGALAAYQRLCSAGGSVSYGEVLLSEQLQLIEGRMNQIVHQRRQEQARDMEAGRLYLQDKYYVGKDGTDN